MADWEQQLRRERARKDAAFADPGESPLPPVARTDFDGLEYYPPAPRYRFDVTLDPVEDPDTLTVETTQGREQRYRRVGAFSFDIEEATYSLSAFLAAPGEPLWVPFRDETNGEETYGGGRYLDFQVDDPTGDGVVLDFNRAYSPFCAFADVYECPLVPMENWLDVRIEAGEKVPG